MGERWIVIRRAGEERRVPLRPGLTRIGGGEVEVPLPGRGGDQLHLWDDPARAVFVGRGEPPRSGGRAMEELLLEPGHEIAWGDALLRYETAAEPAGSGAEMLPALSSTELVAWRRLRAGLVVALGLADRVTARGWQRAVRERRFDPDACAEEILARSPVVEDDPRVLERSGLLLRDLLMAPLQRGVHGARRRASRAAKGGCAFLLAQGAAFLVLCLLVLAAALLLRARGTSIDAFLDRLLLRGG